MIYELIPLGMRERANQKSLYLHSTRPIEENQQYYRVSLNGSRVYSSFIESVISLIS